MAELAYAADSKSADFRVLWVRVPPPVPTIRAVRTAGSAGVCARPSFRFTVFDSLSSIHCLQFTVFDSLSSIHCLQFTVFDSLSSIHCLQFTVFDSLSSIHCLRFTVFDSLSSIHCLRWTAAVGCASILQLSPPTGKHRSLTDRSRSCSGYVALQEPNGAKRKKAHRLSDVPFLNLISCGPKRYFVARDQWFNAWRTGTTSVPSCDPAFSVPPSENRASGRCPYATQPRSPR